MNPTCKKVLFRLEQDANGYPPASVEGLWAKAVEGGHAVDNIPFHVYGIAPGDLIGTYEEDGQTWFAELRQSSGTSVFRVLVKPRKPSIRFALPCRISAAPVKPSIR